MYSRGLAVTLSSLVCVILAADCFGIGAARPSNGMSSPAPAPTGKLVPLSYANYGLLFSGTIIKEPASGIEITRAFYVEIPDPRYLSPSLKTREWWPSECVFFVNRDPRPVTHIQFLFSWTSALGKPEGEDPLDVRPRAVGKGVFAYGKPEVLWPGGTASQPFYDPLCRDPYTKRATRNDAWDFSPKFHNSDVWKLSVRVTRVDYGNGTSWGALWYAPGTKPEPTGYLRQEEYSNIQRNSFRATPLREITSLESASQLLPPSGSL